MKNHRIEKLQDLPKVGRLLEDDRIAVLIENYPRSMVIDGIREFLDGMRERILEDDDAEGVPDVETFIDAFIDWAENAFKPGLKRAVNGMGIILHTGLGRAPFAKAAQDALMDAVANYCTLQIDAETGRRGDRYENVESLLKQITGAEAGLVVNNNAAATLLILNALAGGREVIVSRGELVEIGGSYRIPDVMKRSGARLVEVGTTNRTHLKDYKDAIRAETGLILRVHQSNYKIIGFTKIVPLDDLVHLAHESGIPLIDDLGSGALFDLSRWGLPKEPTAQESIRAGADVICFSGDKLLGGPQCGIIIGKKEYIDRIKQNQLTRALRVDKMTFAVLESTLRLFLDEKKLIQAHPVLGMLTESPESIKKRCQSLKRSLKAAIGDRGLMEIMRDVSEVGSGSLAAENIPTWGLSIHIVGWSAEELAKKLRLSNPPVFGRVKENRYILDCRTIRRDEFGLILQAFRSALKAERREKTAGISESDAGLAEKIIQEVREINEGQKTA